MAIDQIPVLAQGPQDGLTGQAEAVLREIATLLERLVYAGESGSIDLRSLPLSAADRDWLRERLGRGEVSISLDAGGASYINDTLVPGVWWVEHRNEADRVISEFIEVATLPSLVVTHPDDIKNGLERLKHLLD